MASYTWSESTGLNPTFNSGGGLGEQGAVFWDSTTMSNPNIFYGATSDRVLGGDRTHILRLAGNVVLPHEFKLNSVVNIQSGRIYDRRQNYVLPNTTGYIVTSPADDRLPTQYLWDFGVGKHFNLGKETGFQHLPPDPQYPQRRRDHGLARPGPKGRRFVSFPTRGSCREGRIYD